jgi:hypothetical protein
MDLSPTLLQSMSYNETKPDEETSTILQLPEMKGVRLVRSPRDKYWWINKIYKYGQAFQRISYGQLEKVIMTVKELNKRRGRGGIFHTIGVKICLTPYQ